MNLRWQCIATQVMLKDKEQKIIFMGPVGGGKSTQAKLLADYLKIPHIEMGGLLRNFSKTTEGQKVEKLLKAGKFAPNMLTLKILSRELKKRKYRHGFVADGVPRNLIQAKKLPFEPNIVIYLVVSDSENTKRLLLRGRLDDTKAVIRHRLEIYYRQTEPILNFYRRRDKLLEINGERPIEVIFQDIVGKLKI